MKSWKLWALFVRVISIAIDHPQRIPLSKTLKPMTILLSTLLLIAVWTTILLLNSTRKSNLWFLISVVKEFSVQICVNSRCGRIQNELAFICYPRFIIPVLLAGLLFLLVVPSLKKICSSSQVSPAFHSFAHQWNKWLFRQIENSRLPPIGRVFSDPGCCGFISKYTHTNGLNALTVFLTENSFFPRVREGIVSLARFVLTRNYFEFNDSFFLKNGRDVSWDSYGCFPSSSEPP